MVYDICMETKVTTKNMVTIPAEISRKYAISPGCRLDWEPVKGSGDEIRVRVIPKRADLARRLMGRGRRFLGEGDDPIRALVEDRSGEDEAEGL